MTTVMQQMDPRPDKEDREVWDRLLWNCWNTDKSLYYELHGIRCGGAEIMPTMTGYKLIQGDWSEDEWEGIKRNKLTPIRDKLVKIFRLTRFGRVDAEGLPDGVFEQKGA